LLISVDRPQPGIAVVVPNGELDLSNQDKLRDILDGLMDEEIGFLIVDLRRLRFMDSSGLRVLIDGFNQTSAANRRFGVVAPRTGIIAKLLEVTGCDRVFRVGEDTSQLLIDSPD
jgi:anti-anti-sigma factor